MKKRKKRETDTSPFPPRSDHTTVKTSLKKIIRNYPQNFPIINQLVLEAQEIVVQTYLFLRLYLLHLFHQGEILPEINSQFILYCLRTLGTRAPQGKKSADGDLQQKLQHFYQEQFQPLLGDRPPFSLRNKSYLIPYLAQKIETGFHNNLRNHFLTRFRRYLNRTLPTQLFPLDTRPLERKKIANQVKDSILSDQVNQQCPSSFRDWAQEVPQKLLPQTYQKSFAYDAKANPSRYLPITIQMNQELEQSEERCRLFQPIPLRTSMVPGYLTIDTNVILSTFPFPGEKGLNKKTREMSEYIWGQVFRTDSQVFRRKGYRFTALETDGVGVSLHFEREDLPRGWKKKRTRES